MGLKNFIAQAAPGLLSEYIVDRKLESGYRRQTTPDPEPPKSSKPKFTAKSSPMRKIKKISQLPVGHSAREYVNKRKLPSKEHYRVFYTPKFATWVNSMLPNKLKTEMDYPRLILPFFDKNGQMFGFQGRALSAKRMPRYITIMLDEDHPKLFGLDKVDFTSRYTVVEGPIDSLFLNNSIAMAGADANASGLEHTENAIFVFDNEPRNAEIIKRMQKCIDKGYHVCIWPSHITAKDINDMVLSGIRPTDLQLIIEQNTYRSLAAHWELQAWSKV